MTCPKTQAESVTFRKRTHEPDSWSRCFDCWDKQQVTCPKYISGLGVKHCGVFSYVCKKQKFHPHFLFAALDLTTLLAPRCSCYYWDSTSFISDIVSSLAHLHLAPAMSSPPICLPLTAILLPYYSFANYAYNYSCRLSYLDDLSSFTTFKFLTSLRSSVYPVHMWKAIKNGRKGKHQNQEDMAFLKE